MLFPDPNGLTFGVSAAFNIKSFVVLNVDEVLTEISEDLPPIGVCVINLKVVSSTIGLNVQGLLVLPRSDGFGLIIEVPGLRFERIWCL